MNTKQEDKFLDDIFKVKCAVSNLHTEALKLRIPVLQELNAIMDLLYKIDKEVANGL